MALNIKCAVTSLWLWALSALLRHYGFEHYVRSYGFMPLNSTCAVTALWLWTANIDGFLDQCQPTVYDAGPALIQRCVDVLMSPDSSHHLRSLSWSSLAYMSTKIVYRLVHSLIQLLIHPFVRSFVHSFVCVFFRSFVRTFVHSFSFLIFYDTFIILYIYFVMKITYGQLLKSNPANTAPASSETLFFSADDLSTRPPPITRNVTESRVLYVWVPPSPPPPPPPPPDHHPSPLQHN